MIETQQAGADGKPAPAALQFRAPTFGDWLECGDISRQTIVNPKQTTGEVAVEFKVNAHAVAGWFEALSGRPASEIRGLPISAGRRAFADLMRSVPPFDNAAADGVVTDTPAGLVFTLEKPLPSPRAQLDMVTVRRPEVGDWLDIGNIYVQRAIQPEADGQPQALEVKLDEMVVGRWMQRLTGLPQPILELMSYADARRVFAHMKTWLGGLDEGNASAP